MRPQQTCPHRRTPAPQTGDSQGLPDGTRPLASHTAWGGTLRPERLLYADGTALTVYGQGDDGDQAWPATAAGAVPASADSEYGPGLLQVVRWDQAGQHTVVHPALTCPRGTARYPGLTGRERERQAVFDAAEAFPSPVAYLLPHLVDPGDVLQLERGPRSRMMDLAETESVTATGDGFEFRCKGLRSPRFFPASYRVGVLIPAGVNGVSAAAADPGAPPAPAAGQQASGTATGDAPTGQPPAADSDTPKRGRVPVRYMNDAEIEEAAARWHDHPVLGPATRTLANLQAWTDANSDGWPYWSAPLKAAARLINLIVRDGTADYVFDDERADATVKELRAAYTPIRRFRTSHDADFEIVNPGQDAAPATSPPAGTAAVSSAPGNGAPPDSGTPAGAAPGAPAAVSGTPGTSAGSLTGDQDAAPSTSPAGQPYERAWPASESEAAMEEAANRARQDGQPYYLFARDGSYVCTDREPAVATFIVVTPAWRWSRHDGGQVRPVTLPPALRRLSGSGWPEPSGPSDAGSGPGPATTRRLHRRTPARVPAVSCPPPTLASPTSTPWSGRPAPVNQMIVRSATRPGTATPGSGTPRRWRTCPPTITPGGSTSTTLAPSPARTPPSRSPAVARPPPPPASMPPVAGTPRRCHHPGCPGPPVTATPQPGADQLPSWVLRSRFADDIGELRRVALADDHLAQVAGASNAARFGQVFQEWAGDYVAETIGGGKDVPDFAVAYFADLPLAADLTATLGRHVYLTLTGEDPAAHDPAVTDAATITATAQEHKKHIQDQPGPGVRLRARRRLRELPSAPRPGRGPAAGGSDRHAAVPGGCPPSDPGRHLGNRLLHVRGADHCPRRARACARRPVAAADDRAGRRRLPGDAARPGPDQADRPAARQPGRRSRCRPPVRRPARRTDQHQPASDRGGPGCGQRHR